MCMPVNISSILPCEPPESSLLTRWNQPDPEQPYTDTHTHTHTHTHKCLTAFFSRTTWVGHYQKDKPFWILLKQEMMGWRWHQLSHMQIICTSLQTDNHASTSSLHFFTGRMPFLPPNQQHQSTESQTQNNQMCILQCSCLLFMSLQSFLIVKNASSVRQSLVNLVDNEIWS